MLVDRGPLAGATTAVAAGMLAPVSEADPQEAALVALGLESARRWPAFAAELADVSGIDVGYRACGTLLVARDADEAGWLQRELALRERLGPRGDGAAALAGARAGARARAVPARRRGRAR